MITAVSLNPSIDRFMHFERFEIGATNRVVRVREDLSGKGVNVALSAAALGARVRCVGFMRSARQAAFDRMLEAHGVEHACVTLPGDVRVNMKLVDGASGIVTEVNQAGEPVTAADVQNIIALVRAQTAPGNIIVLCGSMPPGCPPDLYATLIQIATEAGALCALDADRAYLKHAVYARPYLIKPNRAELSALMGRPISDLSEAHRAAGELVAAGIRVVLVSLGADGALMADADGAVAARALEGPVVSTVGAGDALLAGFTAALSEGRSHLEAFKLAMASAAASVSQEGTQPIDRARAASLLGRVQPFRI